MSERGQRMNSRAFVPVSHNNGYTDMAPRYTNSPYLLDQLSEEEDEFYDTWSDRTTPTSQVPVPRGWSDVTLTESVTGRSSYTSWEEDEGVLDRLAGEQVGRMFDAVNQSLYEGQGTGHDHMNRECLEWRKNFPHFRIKGIHLLDSLEDGTEIVDPVFIDEKDLTTIDSPHTQESSELQIIGRKMKTHSPPSILTGESSEELPGLHYEEILACDGMVEEYFAYNYNTNNLDDKNSVKRPSRTHRYCKLPPVTPSACLRDAIFAMVFDQIWSEVATSLHPLLVRYSRITSRRDSFSESSSLLPSQSHVPIHELYLPTDGAPPTRGGQSALQGIRRRPIAPGPLVAGGNHSMDLPSLQKVMTIKPVPLQQRIPSSTLPPTLSTYNSGLQLHPNIDNPDNSLFHEFSSRFLPNSRQMSFVYTPIPLKGSESKIVFGKIGNKRNHLKPLEVPRTPGLPLMEDDMKEFSGLRGQRLVRHTQLPPIDPSQFDVAKSPLIPRSSGTRGHVTFSNRIVSAVTDTRGESGTSSRKNIISGVTSDLRPNTSQTLHRSDTPLARRGSNNSSIGLPLPNTSSPIKVVGYAANLHGDPILWEEQEEEFIQPSYTGTRSGHNRSKIFHGPNR